jgi:hypothetical protein
MCQTRNKATSASVFTSGSRGHFPAAKTKKKKERKEKNISEGKGAVFMGLWGDWRQRQHMTTVETQSGRRMG